MTQITRDDVRAYYDHNTRLFLRYGSSAEVQTIHRSLWPQGVTRIEQALAVSNDLVLEEARALQNRLGHLRFADLGCGVGATLFHVLSGLSAPVQAVGLTLSPVQAHIAAEARRGLGLSAHLLEADFHHVPLAGGFDLVYSIEAFIHAQQPEQYLREAARLLNPGGRLILLDDFLTTTDPRADAWLEAYRAGWFVPRIQTVETVRATALDLRLIPLAERNLTPWLRLRTLPDGLARFLLNLGQRLPQGHPIVPSMLGSMALQQCLSAGWIEYRWLVFEKQ
jgi:cyclopropane fatty-acyl-phospholipid synthase-like methyltransferase